VTPKINALNILTEATITEAALKKYAGVFLALYENDLQSNVQAGENAGRTLHHQFVVRKWIGPLALNDQGQLRWSKSVSLGGDWKMKDLGVVVCVLNIDNGDTLQAVALSLND
jgi:hypothetical protein